MSVALLGPWAFDASAVVRSGRDALRAADAALRADAQAAGGAAEEPGLYVIAMDGRIFGLWVRFGPGYLEDGTPGAPDRFPAYASGLLEAATEEVWWRNLAVSGDGRGAWSPVVVLEWPPSLAVRASAPPPGVVATDDAARREVSSESERWMDAAFLGEKPGAAAPVVQVEEQRPDPYAGLRPDRGLVAVVQGQLRYTRALHTGLHRLVPPAVLCEGAGLVALEDWLARAAAAEPRALEEALSADPSGAPLALPGGRVAFPLPGWLTRGLELWPERATEIVPGKLPDRVVQTKWRGQVKRALGSMAAVLIGVGGLAVGVRLAAEPRPQPLAISPQPAPQPAMSVCSADHQKFIEEFRCQIDRLSQSAETFPADPACGDPGSPGSPALGGGDLQAAYCGLLDRALDGWTGNLTQRDQTWDFASLAASQACFNVLGHPYPYAQPTGFSGHTLAADPDRFLTDPDLGIASLSELTAQLRDACDTYRVRLEEQVQGAVFSTHIGAPFDPGGAYAGGRREPEPSALRRLLTPVAERGLSADAKRCFEEGLTAGTGATSWRALCGGADATDARLDGLKVWARLADPAGEPTTPVLDRYVQTRFGLAGGAALRGAVQDPLWRCHLTLDGDLPPTTAPVVPSLWDLHILAPSFYRVAGAGLSTQLELDAAMRAFEAGQSAGVCWDVVRRRLLGYEPVHPLLASLNESGWPSPEQQLCGQICAARFRVAAGPDRDRWVTPEADLSLCLSADPPGATPDMGRGHLDQLRLPWSGAGDWVEPNAAQICAFNLVAQDYMPAGDEGFLANGRTPVQWAGETASGSRIAGGPEGLAADAIAGMQRYGAGSGWSTGRCGFVATQCFVGLLTEIMGAEQSERYEWAPRWSEKVATLASQRPSELAATYPWCAPLQPYLGAEEEMAQFDAPCRRGVEIARSNVLRAARTFATGAAEGAR